MHGWSLKSQKERTALTLLNGDAVEIADVCVCVGGGGGGGGEKGGGRGEGVVKYNLCQSVEAFQHLTITVLRKQVT